MSKKPFFWIGHLALAGVVCLAGTPTVSAQTPPRPTTKRAVSSRPAAKAGRPAVDRRAARAPSRRRSKWPTPSLPRYKVDASGDLVPDVRAAAAIIYDPETNEMLWEENSQSQRSIASITKVMTATVFLENNPDLSQPVTVARSDVSQASTTHLARQRQGDGRRPAAPAADRVGQRRRPGARARRRRTARKGSSSG